MLPILGIRAVLRRDIQRALSYRVAFIATGLTQLLELVLFYYVSRLVTVEPFADPDDYFAYVVVGLIALQFVNAVLFFPLYLLTAELLPGTFERTVISPLGPVPAMVSTMVFPFCSAFIASVGTLALGVAVFGLTLSWSTLALAIPTAILVGLAFAPFGLVFMAIGILIKQAAAISGWLITILSLLAGLYFPVALLPDAIEWASDIQPLTPAVDLMRHVIIGFPLSNPGVETLKLVLYAVVLTPPALFCLHRAVRVGKRRGTIVEY